MSNLVVDASAILALLKQELGWESVPNLSQACISTVNVSEVVAKLTEGNISRQEIIERISSLELRIIDFDEEQSVQAGLLRPLTRQFGLSLGDRACLSLAIVKKIPVLTADQAWLQLNLPIDIRTIR